MKRYYPRDSVLGTMEVFCAILSRILTILQVLKIVV